MSDHDLSEEENLVVHDEDLSMKTETNYESEHGSNSAANIEDNDYQISWESIYVQNEVAADDRILRATAIVILQRVNCNDYCKHLIEKDELNVKLEILDEDSKEDKQFMNFIKQENIEKDIQFSNYISNSMKNECDQPEEIYNPNMSWDEKLDSNDANNVGDELKSPLQCNECDKKFSTKKALIKHEEMVHIAIRPFECSLCSYRAATNRNLRIHFKKMHDTAKKFKFKCSRCRKKFVDKLSLVAHLNTVHSKDKFKCSQCTYIGSRKCSLMLHFNRRHRGKLFKCKLCDFKCESNKSLCEHQVLVHVHSKKPLECNHCGYKTKRKCHMTNHVNRHHANKKCYDCSQCDYKCDSEESLSEHIIDSHAETTYFQCNVCSFECAEEFVLVAHVNAIHNDVKRYGCSACDYTNSDNKLLMKHYKSEHQQEKRFRCSYCDYHVGKNYLLQDHVNRIHLKIMRFSCQYCDYKCTTRSYLLRHVKTQHRGRSESTNKVEKETASDIIARL